MLLLTVKWTNVKGKRLLYVYGDENWGMDGLSYKVKRSANHITLVLPGTVAYSISRVHRIGRFAVELIN